MLTKLIIIIIAIILAVGLGFWFYQKAQAPSSDIRYQDSSPDVGYQDINEENIINNMKISSPAFTASTSLPAQYTCSSQNINPPLEISGAPTMAKSLVLVIDDPDAPAGGFIHWLVWNINPLTTAIEENISPEGAVQGKNSFGEIGYSGPCPPKGKGQHHYIFKLYAMDIALDLPAGSDIQAVGQAMVGHIIAQSQLVGLFGR